MPNDGGGGAVVVSDGGNQNQNTGGNDPASNSSGEGNVDLTGLLSALDGDNRQFVEKGGWKDLNAIFKSHREAVKHISSTRNANNNTPSNDAEIPTSADGYEFKLPEKFPTDGFYNKDLAKKFATWAHKAKLPLSTAQTLHDMYVSDVAEMVQASTAQATEQMNTRINSTHAALTKEWGGEETAGFKRNLELARRAITHLSPDLKAALKEHGVLVDHGGKEVVANATIALALGKVGSQLFAEDAVFGANQNASENPFDPKKPNATEAGKLIKSNPELARTLIKAAGPEAERDWSWWLARK